MQYSDLPFARVRPSRLVFGTVSLNEEELEAGFDLLDAAFEAGYNAFDTAALYGGGTCERVLGRWMEARGNRDEVFVIGKGAHHNPDRRRVTPFDITADLFDSLARQRHGRIDLHLLHRDDPDCDVGPIVEILNEHLDAGRIRAFGGSNWTARRIAEANEYAQKHGLVPFAASSPNLSLAVQAQPPWAECLSLSGPDGAADRDWYRRQGMPLFTWSSLAGGFFSGRLTRQNREEMGEGARRVVHRLLLHRGQLRAPRPRRGAGGGKGGVGAAGRPGLGPAPGPRHLRPGGAPQRARVRGERRRVRHRAHRRRARVARPAARAAGMRGNFPKDTLPGTSPQDPNPPASIISVSVCQPLIYPDTAIDLYSRSRCHFPGR